MKTGFTLVFLAICVQTAYPVYFKHIEKKEGLSQLSVLSIKQDKLGRIWFGTEEGLNMYDGEKIAILQPSDTEEKSDGSASSKTIPGNHITMITEDSNGNLFFKADQALVKYDLYKARFHTLREKGITTVAASKGEVWAVVADSVYKWNEHNNSLELFYKTGLHGIVRTILWDKSDRLWIGTNNGLYVMDKNKSITCIIPDIEIYALYESSKNEIWVSSRNNGLFQINSSGSITKFLHDASNPNTIAHNQVREIVEDNRGSLWIGTFKGLNKYNPNTKQFTVYVKDNTPGSMSHSSVFSLYKDNQGTIWAGTYYGGVNYFNPGSDIFTYYAESPIRFTDVLSSTFYSDNLSLNRFLNFPYIGNMVEDNSGNIWICTEGGGLNLLNRKTKEFHYFTAKNHSNTLKQNNLKCICYDSIRNKLYIGTHTGGLSCYDITKNTFKNFLDTDRLSSIIPDMQIYGDKLIFISNRELFQMDLNTESITPFYTDTIKKKQIGGKNNDYMLIDSKGYLWLAKSDRIVRIHLTDGQPEEEIYMSGSKGFWKRETLKIFETKDGKIYFGTRGSGLFLFNETERTFVRYSAEQNQLLSDYCYNIAESGMEYLIITGDKGISFFDPKKSLVKQVALGSGLPIRSINKDCGLLVCRNGEIFAGGTDGLISFFEQDLYRNEKDYQLYFSELYINNVRVLPDDNHKVLSRILPYTNIIDLNYRQNNIMIDFASNNYVSTQENAFYEYMLEGFDEAWISTNDTRLNYTNLNPGKYILKIREKDVYNHNILNNIQLKINIHPPFYATPLAYIIYLVFASIILYTIIRFRHSRIRLAISLESERRDKKRIEQLNQSKLQFFTNISHEFKTPLTLIISQIDLLMQNSSLSPSIYNKLLRVYKNASRMGNLISELLDFRKLEQKHISLKIREQNIVDFLKEIYLSFYEYAQSHSVTYLFKNEDNKLSCLFDPEQLQKVFYNLLSNAFKFTPPGGTIEMIISQNADEIIVRVTDTGIGIEAKDLEHIFDRFYQANETGTFQVEGTGIGLPIAKSVVELHHGTIAVESYPQYGSVFTVHLLKGDKHFLRDASVKLVSQQLDVEIVKPDTLPDTIFIEQMNEVPSTLSNSDKDGRPVILIIEDREELLQILASLFSPLYHVLLARNGEEGLRKTQEEKPNLILSDVLMPVMSGKEMCQRIKNNIDLCHIPVVLLTALSSPEQNIEGLQLGADDYIGKPFNAKILLARCNNLIRSRSFFQKRLQSQPDFDVQLLANNPLDKKFLEKVEKIMEQHLTDPDFGIDMLAQELAMSRSSLFTKFKALTGLTPNDYMLNAKLKQAAVLLKNNPELQIVEISDRLGFNSARYFSRCFKAQFNKSPREYRES
jgi:signal transduction histidine kinase/ligand-binding sensor domain-containing protein/DNA-binding response OmpR family regulator